jgi:hypothetical protein
VSDYLKEQARSRQTLDLPKKPSPARTSDAEKAQRLYGKPEAPVDRRAAATLSSLDDRLETQPLPIGQVMPGSSPPTLEDLDRYAQTIASMNADRSLASASAAAGEYRRFRLSRDRDRPLEFDGRVRAQVDEPSHNGQVLLRAAIYETRGGKFVAEVTRRQLVPFLDYGTGKQPFLFAKATVFDNLDLAAMSFRTSGGRLTSRLLAQIADLNSEFVE